MDISAGLIAKTLAGLSAVAATTAGLAYGDQILELWQRVKLTKWDNALINYLKEGKKDSNKDITFTVKTGKDGNTNLSNTFPSFEDAEGEGEDNKQKSIITVTVTTSSDNLTAADSTTEIGNLKKKNGGKDWTWECKIIFSKDKVNGDNLDLENKDKLIGENGFFNKLASANNKDLKIKFIKNCAKSRDIDEFNKYEEKTTLADGEKITSERTFELLKKESGNKNWKIKQREFNDWFSEIPPNKQVQTQIST